jgi:TfoX/Sxy family transcriptional regulator of competence genes
MAADRTYWVSVAYDEQLAERVRRLIDADERRMFSGISFMVGGNIAVAVRDDELLVRVDPDERDDLIESEPGADIARMGKRTMKGWLVVDAAALAEDSDLERWVRRGEGYAASLPPK